MKTKENRDPAEEHATDYEPSSPIGNVSEVNAQQALEAIAQERLTLAKHVNTKNGRKNVEYWLI